MTEDDVVPIDLKNPSGEVLSSVETLWEYHRLGMGVPSSADLLLVGGSHDLRVAVRAAEVATSGVYRWIIVSGGAGKVTGELFSEPESVIFKRVMVERGVDEGIVLTETEARHTGDNIVLSRAMLGKNAETVRTGLLLTKPYMERRFLATAQQQWRNVAWSVSSPDATLEEYLGDDDSAVRTIELMVGDLQRIQVYGDRGIQAKQDIPERVWRAYERLVKWGYDGQVMKS